MTTAARKVLGDAFFEDLVRNVQEGARAAAFDDDPFWIAALVAVAKRLEHPELYPWPREARQIAMAIVIEATLEAERRARPAA